MRPGLHANGVGELHRFQWWIVGRVARSQWWIFAEFNLVASDVRIHGPCSPAAALAANSNESTTAALSMALVTGTEPHALMGNLQRPAAEATTENREWPGVHCKQLLSCGSFFTQR